MNLEIISRDNFVTHCAAVKQTIMSTSAFMQNTYLHVCFFEQTVIVQWCLCKLDWVFSCFQSSNKNLKCYPLILSLADKLRWQDQVGVGTRNVNYMHIFPQFYKGIPSQISTGAGYLGVLMINWCELEFRLFLIFYHFCTFKFETPQPNLH